MEFGYPTIKVIEVKQ